MSLLGPWNGGQIKIKNAIIESASIMIEDHGLLSAWVQLDYGGSGQGFGGFSLYLPPSFKHAKDQGPAAGHFIFRVLQVAGVERWDKLPGKTVRVRAEHGKVHAIGHIVNDDWFDPAKDFEAMREGAA